MKILVCGQRSYAAEKLPQVLEAAGHEVASFSRGPVARQGNAVTGPVELIHENPHLQEHFDAVVNYILLKDGTIEANLAYADSLLKFCAAQKVPHLVQIASVSSFKSELTSITENAEIETQYDRKGGYGSIKAASDHRIVSQAPPGTKVSLLHAGFIMAPGMIHPFIGMGARMPWNRLLVLGNGRSQFPVIDRNLLDAAVLKVLTAPPAQAHESLLMADTKSPSRKAYLQACCTLLGAGTGVDVFPNLVWQSIAVLGESIARAAGKADKKPYLLITSKLPNQRVNSRRTEKRLGMSLSTDWKGALKVAVDGQEPNFDLPYKPSGLPSIAAQRVTFLGYGRIVKTRHAPALKTLGFDGELKAFDLMARTDEDGQVVEKIEGAQLPPSDLYVVATPGPAHTSAIPQLEAVSGPILVEKPLCYTPEDLERWEAFAAARQGPVYACHNYRFKRNVAQMLAILARYNSGRLRHVSVQFDSPSVSLEPAAWARNERRARTLLMDYSIHFLDVACLFGQGQWRLDTLRSEINSQGQTSLIEGRWEAENYPVAFLLRQGFGPRKVQVLYNFQNYSIRLGFFPDTCVAYMTDQSAWLHKQEAKEWGKGFYRKAFDLLSGKDSDASHALLVGSILNGQSSLPDSVTIPHLRSFYDVLFETSNRVYDQ